MNLWSGECKKKAPRIYKAISASDHQLYFFSFLEKDHIKDKTINLILLRSPRVFFSHIFLLQHSPSHFRSPTVFSFIPFQR